MPETVVLLPGLQSDHRSWTHQIAHLRQRYSVVVPTGYHGCESVPEMAEHVLAQMPPRFHFVAWSMGGYVALQMLPRLRGRLISLVLMSTSARPEDPANTARRLDNLATAEREGMAASNERSLAFSCLDVDALSEAQRHEVRQSAIDLGIEAYRAQQHAIINRPDGRKNLALIDCPTLIVVGDNDAVTTADRAVEMHEAVPGSELRIIEACGHCPPLEHPMQINALLETWFLNRSARAGWPLSQP